MALLSHQDWVTFCRKSWTVRRERVASFRNGSISKRFTVLKKLWPQSSEKSTSVT